MPDLRTAAQVALEWLDDELVELRDCVARPSDGAIDDPTDAAYVAGLELVATDLRQALAGDADASPTERHMAEAEAIVARTQASPSRVPVIAQALAQAERRGAEAVAREAYDIAMQCSAGGETIGDVIAGFDRADLFRTGIPMFGTAPPATPAPDPAPAADVRAAAVPLAECPPGLFEFEGRLGFRSEYRSNEGWPDAYVVESGEYFWGGAERHPERAELMVLPLTTLGRRLIEP